MYRFNLLFQIAGSHAAVYEAYYKQADPNSTGSIGALDAATFLKKSGLPDTVLSKVWDLSDQMGKGYLEKSGFYIALKLVAMAQNNQDLNITKLTDGSPPPSLGPVEIDSSTNVRSGANIPWAVTAAEITKYDQVFQSLHPVNGLLSGDKVKPVLINSKLPMDVLGQIWELSDVDKDGYLDREEFTVAMHLVYKALEKEPVPKALPLELIPPSKRRAGGPPVGGVPVLPGLANRPSPVQRSGSPAVGVPWVITSTDKASYDVLFKKSDLDLDGFVSGEEIRGVFLQSALPNNVLAHIWNLCDIKAIGKLNSEQFALAMYLIQQKLKGVDPPSTLTPEMIPPSMRAKSATDTASFGVAEGVNAGPYSHVADPSAIKELDVISKEIENMKREKMQIEMDNNQKEADIKIINGEVQTLQKELDAITATLQQLENQKKEAQKRLDELDEKKSNLESNVRELKEKVENEMKQINDLRSQLNDQEKSVQNQEKELEKLRVELSSLKDEEGRLETNVESGKQQLEALVKSQKDLQVQVNQTRTRVQHLDDQQRGVKLSVASYNSSLNGEVSSIFSSANNEDTLSTHATIGSSPALSTFSMGSTMDDFKEDPFKSKDLFTGGNDTSQADPFQSDDPFKENDPFKAESFTSDPFSSDDPFKSTFESGGSTTTKKADPFGNMDPFASAFGSSTSNTSTDAFDPFGMGSSSKPSKPGSLFDSDPFAPQSPAKSSSPAPSLPPKSKKQPPPRPAPPKSRPTPSPSQQPDKGFGAFDSDPFGGSDPFASSGGASSNTGTADPFANFADFSPSKFRIIVFILTLASDDAALGSQTMQRIGKNTSSSTLAVDGDANTCSMTPHGVTGWWRADLGQKYGPLRVSVIAMCSKGYFGPQCQDVCGYCHEGAACRPTDGHCLRGCSAGWMGAMCKTGCPFGKYGVNCSVICGHCKEISRCNRVSGMCETGCRPGWRGWNCKEGIGLLYQYI
ncbi:hypothetical protein FSP39_023778 [Pinctada imbricata]|uniref:Epidermal growth factor receptor substrate 15-like 1 n=1 Tax=Pinctada imbricata TaxID=66713 RepID=A0AA88XUJ7_PINIB|nr:hypothetical protein FSP39_023778 [Pinctada imbricata]